MVPDSGNGRPDETRPMKVLRPGSRVSHYTIVDKIGQGGMGVVYRAEDTKLKRTVALKFLPPYLTEDPNARERFIHEAQAASSLDHHNICTIYEVDGTEDGHTFISMACYEGETLREKIEKGHLALDEVLDIGHQISEGLAKAHGKGIVHRDLKPANIMITDDGVAKIMDFGLAKLAGRTRITRTGTTMGTPAYMSPEQAQGGEVDQRSDIFSLGVILYEMIAGRPPFKGEYEAAVLHSILYEEPAPLSDSRPGTPDQLQRIVSRALEKDAHKRYQTTHEMRADLASLREEKRAGVAIKLQRIPIRKRFIIPAIAVIAVVVAYIAFLRNGPEDSGQPSELAQEDLFTIVVAPFWGATDEAMEEGKVMQALVERKVRDELGDEANVRILSETVPNVPRSQGEASGLGEDLDATVVIWGEVIRLHDEVEIQPHLTLVTRSMVFWNPVGSTVLDLSTRALEADLSEPSQLALRKMKAEEVGNLVLMAAAYYYGGQDAEKARAILKRIVPHSSTSVLVEALIEFDRDRRAEAESLCFEAAALDTLDPWPYYTLGTMYTLLKRHDEAIHNLTKALALAPDRDEFRWWLALAHARKRDDEALALYRAVVEREPENPGVRVRLGWLYEELGHSDEAIEEFKLATRLDPGNLLAYRGLGYAYEFGDSLSRSVESYGRAKELATSSEDRATMCWLLGRAYWRQRRHEEALVEFNEAIALRPNDAIYYMVMTFSYRELDRVEEGLTIIQEAVGAHPGDPQFLEILGGAYLTLRRPREAIATLGEAIRLNPYYGDAYFGMGNAYMQLDSLAKAVSCYRKAKRLGILYYGDRNYYLLSARSYLGLGMYGRAVEELLKAIEREPDNAELHLFLGVAYMYQGDYDSATTELGTSAELASEPDGPSDAHVMLGVVYTHLGRYEQAVAELRKATELNPDFVYYDFFYSIALHRVGREEEGRTHLRQLAESVEGDSWENLLLRFLTGGLDETTLLSKANDEDPRTDRQHRCEAYYYIGVAYVLDTDASLRSGHPDATKAQAYLERCLETRVANFAEYAFARAELARLQGD